MATIDSENAKAIREPFEVHVGISSRDPDVDISFSGGSNVAAIDTNISVAIDEDAWEMRRVADLQGDGFVLDEETSWYNASLAASVDNGKLGIRSHIGGTMSVTITSNSNLDAVTLRIYRGTGLATYSGHTYELKPLTVIPLGSMRTATITISSDEEDGRVEISSITPSVTLEFDNTTLISCTLDLRSDLSREEPTWQESAIEVQAYYPLDIEETIANMPEDSEVWYYAGYPSNFSTERHFYLDGQASLEDSLLSFTAVDASRRLEDVEIDATVMNVDATSAERHIYRQLIKTVSDLAGIRLRSKESTPTVKGNSKVTRPIVIKEKTAREHVAELINLGHVERVNNLHPAFWPTFVDAGIPKIYWTKPTSKWTIPENMTSGHVRNYERNIAAMKTTDEYGIKSKLVKKPKKATIDTVTVEKDEIYSTSFEQYYSSITVTNATIIKATASSVTFKAKTTGTSVIKGNRIAITEMCRKVTSGLYGKTISTSPAVIGRLVTANADGSLNSFFPAYIPAMRRSSVVGSFEFRGDPRMQPRDVFTFERLDGTTETCTIETITLRHEGGGTTATITYRKGIC